MDKNKLTEVLLQLRAESILANADPTEDNLKALMNKYDMLFLGKNFNQILSIELAHSLRSAFDIQVEVDVLNNMIPGVCSLLGMKFEPLINVSDAGKANPPIACYKIWL